MVVISSAALAAQARAQYVPKARLKIATDFASAHSSDQAMVACVIDHWFGNVQHVYESDNGTISAADWAQVPPNLQGIYKGIDKQYRATIQGVDS